MLGSQLAARDITRWALGAPRELPLVLLRFLVGAWAAYFSWTLAAKWPPYATSSGTSGGPLAVDGLPGVGASILRVRMFDGNVEFFCALAIMASLALMWGFYPKIAAFGLWLTVTGYCRASYPVAARADELLAGILFWSLLLPIKRQRFGTWRTQDAPGCRATVAAFLIFVGGFWDADPAIDGIILLAGVLAVLALLPSRPERLVPTLDAGLVVGVVALAITSLTSVATALQLNRVSRALSSVAWDVGLLRAAPPSTDWRAIRIEARDRASTRYEVQQLWPGLGQASSVWVYLRDGRQRLPATHLQRIRMRGAVRQAVADRACGRLDGDVVIDVFERDIVPSEALLSFYCRGKRSRLVPARVLREKPSLGSDDGPIVTKGRKLAFEHSLADEQGAGIISESQLLLYLKDAEVVAGKPPLVEMVRVAHLRMAAREYDEAIRLLEATVRAASPHQRTRAGLDHLLAVVRRSSQRAEP